MEARKVFIIEVGKYQINTESMSRFDATSFHLWLCDALQALTPEQRSVAELSIWASSCGDDLPEINDITLSYQRWETDDEVHARLAAEAKARAVAELQRESRERQEYERLKRKYEGNT